MRSKILLAAVVLLTIAPAAYSVDRISVEQVLVDGFVSDTISPGSSVTVTLRWENDVAHDITGYTNVFTLNSPDGGTWSNLVGTYLPAWTTATSWLIMDILNNPPMGGDILFNGATLSGPGAPAGTSVIGWQLSFDVPDVPENYGATICLDTPPQTAGTWGWGDGTNTYIPEWDGPHCWQVLALNPDSCCEGRTGDVDGAGTYPEEIDSTDLGKMVLYLFSDPGTVTLPCDIEADVDASGGTFPIDSSDLGTLVNFLFSTPGSVVLPDCP